MLRRLFRNRFVQVMMIVTVVVIGSGFWFLKVSGHANPGPLNNMGSGMEIGGFETHAMFEQECTHCHGPIHCVIPENCQDCHLEIAAERIEASGLHGRLPAADSCGDCHVEHQGHDAQLISMPMPNIDHTALAGFDLVDHSADYNGNPIVCEDCHTENRFSAETVDCVSCHAANEATFMGAHMAELGRTCTDCHNGRDGHLDFDHDLIFVKDGAHLDLPCEDCHTNRQTSKSTECTVCHEPYEWHGEQFGIQCERCHSTAAWLPAQLRKHGFDRLHGSAEPVACETCHIENYVTYTCTECHDHDPEIVRDQHPDLENDATLWACAQCHPTGHPSDIMPVTLLQR